MTSKRPLLELAELSGDLRIAEILRAADALLEGPFIKRNSGYECRFCGSRWQTFRDFPHHDGCRLPEYQRAVEAWEQAND
jgi:hypothetical protein